MSPGIWDTIQTAPIAGRNTRHATGQPADRYANPANPYTPPAERIGNRHRLLLDDVLTYREQRRKRQYDALAATAIDIDSDDDPETIRKQLRQARRAVAARRRSSA